MIKQLLPAGKTHRLSLRFFFMVLICSLMTFLTTLGLELWIQYREGINQINSNIDHVRRSYLPAVATSLFSVDETQLHLLLRGMLNLEGIVYCTVIEDPEGVGLKITEGQADQVVDKGHAFDLTYRDFSDEPVHIGTLVIYTNYSDLHGKLWQNAAIQIILSSVMVLFTALLVMLIFQRIVARHLFRMAKFARGINLSHLDVKLELNRPAKMDELELVVGALNAMQDQLKQDMAERTRWEERLQLEKDMTQRIIETSPAGIVRLDVQGRVIYANKLAEKIMGVKLSQESDRTYNDPEWRITAIDGTPFDNEKLPFTIVKKTGRPVFNVRHAIEWPDGRRILLSINAAPFFDNQGAFEGMIAAIEDITERFKAQQSLRESKERLSTILESIQIGIVIIDPQTHKIVETNSAAVRMLGDAKENIIGAVCHNYICPAELGACPITDLGHTIDHTERFLLNGKYETIPVLKSVSPIIIDGKEHLLESFVDITERKQLEAQLQQAQKMESIGNLAGGIAHDFNNLLFPIMGMAELLLEDLPKGSPEWKQASEIFKAGQRGSDLVKQILAFSRQTEQQLIPIRIQKILTEVLKLCRATIPANIEIVEEIQSDCGLIMGDATQLHQVAMNLITNAYHAIEPSNGRITVSLKEAEIVYDEPSDNALPPGRCVQLTVADTGIGIDPGTVDKIFDPYFTTKVRGKGTGLGLAVAYGIVKNFHGDIQVASTPGAGTTFTVYFQLLQHDHETVPITPVNVEKGGDEHILLVDDEEPIAHLEKLLLERFGYQVTARTGSVDALETFKSHPDQFDLIISDMTMPNMTGDELTRRLIALRPDIPIIICTGFSERIDQNKAADLGIKGFVMKPIVKAELARVVRKVLDEANR